MKRTMIITTAMCMAGIVLAAAPGGKSTGADRMREALRAKGMEKAAEHLGLTTEQKDEIKTAMQGQREEMTTAFKELHQAREALEKNMRGAQFDDAAARAALNNLTAATEKSIAMRAKMQETMKSILTPEQQAKAGEVMKHLQGRREDMQKRMMHAMKRRGGQDGKTRSFRGPSQQGGSQRGSMMMRGCPMMPGGPDCGRPPMFQGKDPRMFRGPQQPGPMPQGSMMMRGRGSMMPGGAAARPGMGAPWNSGAPAMGGRFDPRMFQRSMMMPGGAGGFGQRSMGMSGYPRHDRGPTRPAPRR